MVRSSFNVASDCGSLTKLLLRPQLLRNWKPELLRRPEDAYEATEAVSYERVEPTPKKLPLSNDDRVLPCPLVPENVGTEDAEDCR